MASRWLKRFALLALAAIVVAALYLALRPRPVPVDVATVGRGPIEVTVDEEGVSRIRSIYRVSAPIAGHLARSSLEAGDRVAAGDTVASIHPADSALLDARSRAEIAAAIKAAGAGVAAAEAEIARVRAQLQFARANLERAEPMARSGTLSARGLDEARVEVESLEAQLAEARARHALRSSELESARARAGEPAMNSSEHQRSDCCLNVAAPVGGVVVRVLTESEQVVAAGTPLVEIGDPADLEIVVDLLSADAVALAPGARARIEDWGGGEALPAVLRRLDPAGFTKVSALGIEEQRVNALLDIDAPRERWQRLGHDFNVHVRILAWRGEDVLRAPVGALFRSGDKWAVFAVRERRARLVPVGIGHRDQDYAEVLHGIGPGDTVILHPSDRVADGVRVEPRG